MLDAESLTYSPTVRRTHSLKGLLLPFFPGTAGVPPLTAVAIYLGPAASWGVHSAECLTGQASCLIDQAPGPLSEPRCLATERQCDATEAS